MITRGVDTGQTLDQRPFGGEGASGRTGQITMSPYRGATSFDGVSGGEGGDALDVVSLADLLRNGFVYPPHSIYRDVKVATSGFDPTQDLSKAPEFHFEFKESGRGRRRQDVQQDWVPEYHRRLCDALAASCKQMRAPWLLQSGGKDSTPLAIAAAEVRPDTTCITYLGGPEENEVASARFVARKLGLRHEALVCDPSRAYDRYLSRLAEMPLVTADFALLSYVDLATTIADEGGDGMVDGMGSDNYMGVVVDRQHRLLSWLARGIDVPPRVMDLPLVRSSFGLSYLLSTLQMNPVERIFPGSRFTDREVDQLLGREVAGQSRKRMALFDAEFAEAGSHDELVAMALTVAGSNGGFAKGLFTAAALGLHAAYPFCDRSLRDWVYSTIPARELVDPDTGTNKVLVRKHIAAYFGELPYVAKKGSFRFDVCGLARERFDDVRDHALAASDLLPGATAWLDRHRGRLGNKFHASRFYLLAVVLPWVVHRSRR